MVPIRSGQLTAKGVERLHNQKPSFLSRRIMYREMARIPSDGFCSIRLRCSGVGSASFTFHAVK